jgi:hypothetical protein
MKGEKKTESSEGADKQETRPPRNPPEESDPTKRPEPGAGGLSRAKYREATEKAVKDIHG